MAAIHKDNSFPESSMLGFKLYMIAEAYFVLLSQFLQSLESREKSQLLKKWGSISRSFARIGGIHKHVSEAGAEIIYPKVNLISLCPSAMSTSEVSRKYALHLHICVHTCVFIYVHKCTYVCVHLCTYMYISVLTCTYKNINNHLLLSQPTKT